MADKVFLIHGWSVATTTTYRGLDRALAAAGFDPSDIQLGHYVSLDDRITVGDLANALDLAIRPLLPARTEAFHFVTHSTGALVVRDWLRRLYAPTAGQAKAGNIVMLAGPQFGSRLAHQGRSLLAKLKWFGDTGDEILHDLELGSPLQWMLAEDLLDSGPCRRDGDARLYAITGDSFRKGTLVARVVPAAAETGSDGTVRTAAANPNLVRLDVELSAGPSGVWTADVRRTRSVSGVPFRVLPQYYHSDSRARGNMGIMRSILTTSRISPRSKNHHEALAAVVACLRVGSRSAQATLAGTFRTQTAKHFAPPGERVRDPGKTYKPGRPRPAFSQLQFRFTTDAGHPLTDYRVEMIAHKDGERLNTKTIRHVHPNRRHPEIVTFFIDHRDFEPTYDYSFAFFADTGTPLIRNVDAEFRLSGRKLLEVVHPNRTTQFDVVIRRAPVIQTQLGGEGILGFTPGTDSALLHFEFDRSGRADPNDRGIPRDSLS